MIIIVTGFCTFMLGYSLPPFMEVGFGDRVSVTGDAPMDEDLMEQYKQLYDESDE